MEEGWREIPRATVSRMPRNELQEVRDVLREAVDATRKTYRQVEDQLGIGHGTLRRLLDGEHEMRVYHLTRLARLLQVHPKEFFELAFPDWPVRHSLAEWVTPDRRKASQRAAHPATVEDLADLIRKVVREELEASLTGMPPETQRKLKKQP